MTTGDWRVNKKIIMLDKYLRTIHFSEYHQIKIQSQAKAIFPLIKTVNFKQSKLIRLFFALRGLPKKMDSIDGFLEQGFILLEEKADEELIIGFLFSIPMKKVKQVAPDQFADFNDINTIKGVWNFKLRKVRTGNVLSTETRVFCPTRITRLFFAFYWLCISYFSGLIRMEILKLIKNEAEGAGRLG